MGVHVLMFARRVTKLLQPIFVNLMEFSEGGGALRSHAQQVPLQILIATVQIHAMAILTTYVLTLVQQVILLEAHSSAAPMDHLGVDSVALIRVCTA